MAEQEKNLGNSVAYFGPFQLDLVKIRLWRGSQEVKLTGKAFAVLRYLVEHPGQLVTKDDLFAAVWPETVVSEATLASSIQEIRQALRDKAKAPRYLETVHRRGYRFLPTVTTQPVQSSTFKVPSQEDVASSQYSVVSSQEEESQKLALSPSITTGTSLVEEANGEVSLESSVQSLESHGQNLSSNGQSLEAETSSSLLDDVQTLDPRLSDSRRQPLEAGMPRRFRWWQVLLLILVLGLGGILTAKWRLVRLVIASYASPPVVDPVSLPLPDKPSLVVLPFTNLSGDPAQEYFSDGLTEVLTSDLSKISSLFVIARNSAFTYKGKAVKVQEVSKEMGVRYVVEGSAIKAGGQVRITAQLIDALTGGHLWSERYDRQFTDILAVQDEITHKIVLALKVKLTKEEQDRFRLAPTDNLEAYDLFLRGWEAGNNGFSKEATIKARQMYERALALDPRYAGAYAALGWTYWQDWSFHWNQDPQNLERAFELAQKALTLDDSLSEAHEILSWIYAEKKQPEQALAEAERAMVIDPNSAVIHGNLATVFIYVAQPEEAIKMAEKALRLDSRDPTASAWYLVNIGVAYLFTGRVEEASATLKRALRYDSNYLFAYPPLAFSYVLQWTCQLSQDPQTLTQALDAAQHAVALNDLLPGAHAALGTVYLSQKQYDQAVSEMERTIALDPNSATSYAALAEMLGWMNRPEESLQMVEQALRRKPGVVDEHLSSIGAAYFLAGKPEEAIAPLKQFTTRYPNHVGPHLALAAAYSELGKDAEARAEVAEVLRLNPNYSLEVARQRSPDKDPARLERGIVALRKAGLK